MKVLRLRVHGGIPALKGEHVWGAEDPGTELRMLPCGHFVVSKYNRHELIPHGAVVSAQVDPGPGRDEEERAANELVDGLLAKARGKQKKTEQPT